MTQSARPRRYSARACVAVGPCGAWASVSAKLTLWSGLWPPAVIAGAAVPGGGLMPAGSVETEGVAAAPPENLLMDAAGSSESLAVAVWPALAAGLAEIGRAHV